MSNSEGTIERQESGYIPPDILVDEKYSFEEGGVRFELYPSFVTLGKFDEFTLFQPTKNQGFTPV